MTRRSGKDVGAEHVDRLRAYLRAVDKLPGRHGKVNVSAVAMACKFDRAVLYNNPACKEMLAAAAAEKGLEGIVARDAPPADKAVIRLERRVHDLEQANAALKAEVYELRRKLARNQIVEDHTVETGRRIDL